MNLPRHVMSVFCSLHWYENSHILWDKYHDPGDSPRFSSDPSHRSMDDDKRGVPPMTKRKVPKSETEAWRTIDCLVIFRHPSEKWWSENQLGWWHKPNINGKIKNGNQSTNQYRINHACHMWFCLKIRVKTNTFPISTWYHGNSGVYLNSNKYMSFLGRPKLIRVNSSLSYQYPVNNNNKIIIVRS